MEETVLLEFENYLFGIKGNKEGMFKIPKEYYTLTNERLKIKRQGVMTCTDSYIELYKVDDIFVVQGMKEKMLGVGEVEIEVSKGSTVYLKSVKDPNGIREKIREAVKKAKQEAGIIYRQNV